MESQEAMERFEQSEAAAERREQFARRAALMVAVLAALLAIATLSANTASEETILGQAKATDTYNEYQANSLKSHLNSNDAQTLMLLAADGPQAAAAKAQAEKLLQANRDKYDKQKSELLPRAQGFERERDVAEAKHRLFQLGEAGFQLGIVLASVAIVTRLLLVLAVGGISGLAGLFFLLDGHLLFLTEPLVHLSKHAG